MPDRQPTDSRGEGNEPRPGGLNYRAGCGALGVLMALFSACGAVAFVSDLITGAKPEEFSAAVALSFLFTCTTVGGALVARHYLRKPPAQPDVRLENRILRLAYAHRARLTVPQVAMHCEVSIERSREALERMVMQGAAKPEVDDDGTITYFFDDLLPSPEQAPRGEVGPGAGPEDA
jgi:hypothetical protein